jgi:hypothetical protein
MNIYQVMQQGKNPGVLPVAAGGSDEPKQKVYVKADPWRHIEEGSCVMCDDDDTVDLTYGEFYEVERIDHFNRQIMVCDDEGDEMWHSFSKFDPEATGDDESYEEDWDDEDDY